MLLMMSRMLPMVHQQLHRLQHQRWRRSEGRSSWLHCLQDRWLLDSLDPLQL